LARDSIRGRKAPTLRQLAIVGVAQLEEEEVQLVAAVAAVSVSIHHVPSQQPAHPAPVAVEVEVEVVRYRVASHPALAAVAPW